MRILGILGILFILFLAHILAKAKLTKHLMKKGQLTFLVLLVNINSQARAMNAGACIKATCNRRLAEGTVEQIQFIENRQITGGEAHDHHPIV